MLASLWERSRLWWILVGIAALIALKVCAGGSASDDDRLSAMAEENAGSSTTTSVRPAALSLAIARARSGALPDFTLIVAGELRLEGIVRDPQHAEVAGAHVTLGRGPGSRTTTTEADGTFFFDGLAPGDYAVYAESGALYGELTGQTLSADSDPLELDLRAGPTLDVLVVEQAGGAPIVGAHVECCSDRSAITGLDGHAIIRAADLARVNVTVTADGHAPKDLTVRSGDDPSVVFSRKIELARGSRVEGLVLDAAGKPVDHAFVEVDDDHKDRHESVFTDPQGVWFIPDLATDTYLAHASSELHIATPDVTFEHDSAIAQRGIVLRVQLGAQVHGIVVDTSNNPVAEVTVVAGGYHADSDAGGHFTLTGMPPDTYDITAYTKTDGAASQKVTIAAREPHELRFVLRPSTIAGIVVDQHGRPVEAARVAAASTDPNGRGYDKTDEHGHFDLGGLPPGTYEVTASRDDQTDRRDDVPIHVQTGTRNLRIVVPELATLRGRVVMDGEPVPYYGYVLADADLDPKQLRHETPVPVRDKDGAFSAGGLLPGPRTVVIVGPGFLRKQIDNVNLVVGKTTDLGDIAVEHGRAVHGRVVTAEGAPVAGAEVVLSSRFAHDGDEVLDGRMLDRYVARSDGSGAFVVDGLPPPDPQPMRIVASTEHSKSREQEVAPEQDNLELVVSAVGLIAGSMDPANATKALVAITSANPDERTIYVNPDESGAFASDPLPVGEYTVRLTGPWTLPMRHVQVIADQTTAVHYAPIPSLTTVSVSWPECSYMYLEGENGGEHLAAAVCENGVAVFEQVVPGSYFVCDDGCTAITVPASPTYSVNLPAAPEQPEPAPE